MNKQRNIRLQTDPFDIASEIQNLREDRTDIGAIVTFTGAVRGTAKGQPISAMSLEHYPGMTEQELSRITDEAHERWTLQGSTIIHRYGDLKPGDDIVLVITLSAHRRAAFEAAEFLMDYLKSKAPFWKKETTKNGDADWVDARDTDTAALTRWQK
jgi:molybdopterin synthase catalytic subunit